MTKREYTHNGIQVRVYESRQEMGVAAAQAVAACLSGLLEQKEEVNMIFAAAPSQQELLAALAEDRSIAWERVNAFMMDEYIGLDAAAPQRFSSFLDEHIFSRCSFRKIHYLTGDQEEDCRAYAALLQRYPADIVLMGIGENGHIAFNDPHTASFDEQVLIKPVTLDRECRMQQVHDGCFPSIEQVPERAITLTIRALIRVPHQFCVVPSAAKREAVTRAVTGEISTSCPASILQTTGRTLLFLDTDSGRDLLSLLDHDKE
jgi:glucosamine-6-phosphate deaminase